jgi:hypothetical protein
MYEFRYALWLKILLGIICLGLIALFGWALTTYTDENKLVFFLTILPVSAAMIVFAVYGIADLLVGKFVLSEDRVTVFSPLGSRMLTLDAISGFRMDANYIRIIPIHKHEKELKVSVYFKGAQMIVAWLSAKYPRLDITEGDEEERQVLQSDEFGITEEERLEKLKSARKLSKIMNGGVWILLIWLLAFPKYYYNAGILLCVIYPFAALFLMMQYRGLISADEYDESKMPSVGLSFIVPGVTLALRALYDFNIMKYPAWVWWAIVGGSLVMSALYILPTFTLKTRPGRTYITGGLMVLLNLFYVYGVITLSNCMLDKSRAVKFDTTIAGKHVTKGKTSTYYLDLKPWGQLSDEQQVKVSRHEYESARKGDLVVVMQRSGYLGVPWIMIRIGE